MGSVLVASPTFRNGLVEALENAKRNKKQIADLKLNPNAARGINQTQGEYEAAWKAQRQAAVEVWDQVISLIEQKIT